jgi:hypothetical protein
VSVKGGAEIKLKEVGLIRLLLLKGHLYSSGVNMVKLWI